MTIVRIAALAVLLGSSVAALIWFGWGAVLNLMSGRTAPAEPERAAERPAKASKPA